MITRLQDINTVNTVLMLAEREILEKTGLRVQLMVVDDMPVCGKGPKEMLRVIAAAMGMWPSDYITKSRKMGMVMLRHMGCWFLNIYFPELGFNQIGALICPAYDYSVVQHAIKKVSDMLQVKDELFMIQYDNVLNAINKWQSELTSQLNSN